MKSFLSKKYLKIVLSLVLFVTLSFFILLKEQGWFETSEQAKIIELKQMSPKEMLSQMSLEEKVGQMMMVGFWGDKPDYYINKMIEERNVGGVILLKYNIKTKEQLKSLINDLQLRSNDTNPGIPLFVAVDQEGGQVSRVKVEGVSEFTAQAEIETKEEAFSVALDRGKELRALGINTNFSPVLDYLTDINSFLYSRTFQKSLNETSKWGQAMIEGYQKNIIAVPKHFLGHPEGIIDPHASEVYSNFTSEQVKERIELFKGLNANAPPAMIMTSHVTYDQLPSKVPCSLSKACIKGWLQQDAGLSSSVIITDDMEMGAIQGHYTNAEAAVMAIQAGNDILLYSSSPKKQAEAYNAIIKAVEEGELEIQKIDESVLKILELKKKYLFN